MGPIGVLWKVEGWQSGVGGLVRNWRGCSIDEAMKAKRGHMLLLCR